MSYDEELAHRIRACLQAETGLTEKRMFGGLAFMIEGHLAVAASRDGGLLLRNDPTRTETLLARAHAGPFIMRDRSISGWLRVDSEGVRTTRDLTRWVDIGVQYVRTLST